MQYTCVGSVILLILGYCAFATQHDCPNDGCRDGPGRFKCQSCTAGCYGHNCSQLCKGECDSDGCDRTTGKCFRCKRGLYGSECNKRCPYGCHDNNVNRYTYCDRQTGLCQELCVRGKTGSHCHEDCPAKCKESVCMKSDGKCVHGCQDGWGGPSCNISCENCLYGRCVGDGYCTLHCKPGFYGDRCEKSCPKCYITGCHRYSGRCEQCLPGYYGQNCKQECSAKCYQGRDGYRHCDRDNGRCLEGCESGYHGLHCKSACNRNCRQNECYTDDGACVYPCEKGRYGSHCNASCERCAFGCNRHTGVCINGCKNCVNCDKKTGKCLKCPDGFHGDSCTKLCGVNCQDGICNINGTCINGCKGSFHGYVCDKMCNQNCQNCSQFSGECVLCKKNYRLNNSDCMRIRETTSSPFIGNSANSRAYHIVSESATSHILLFAVLYTVVSLNGETV